MDALDPREMRKRLTEYAMSWSDFVKLDGEHVGARRLSTTRPIVRAVFTQAQVMGWSGEDTMTALAYHALLQVERSNDTILDSAMMAKPAPIVLVKTAASLSDEQIDKIFDDQYAEYGQLCDRGDMRIFARSCIEAAKPT